MDIRYSVCYRMYISVWAYTFMYVHTPWCINYIYVSGISRHRMIVRMFMHFNVWPYLILYAIVGKFCMTIHLYVCPYTFAPPAYYIIYIFYMGMHYYVCSYTFCSTNIHIFLYPIHFSVWRTLIIWCPYCFYVRHTLFMYAVLKSCRFHTLLCMIIHNYGCHT